MFRRNRNKQNLRIFEISNCIKSTKPDEQILDISNYIESKSMKPEIKNQIELIYQLLLKSTLVTKKNLDRLIMVVNDQEKFPIMLALLSMKGLLTQENFEAILTIEPSDLSYFVQEIALKIGEEGSNKFDQSDFDEMIKSYVSTLKISK